MYYVYMYLDQDNIPFYIGKGKRKRYLIRGHLHKNNRNPFLENKIRKVGCTDVKIQFLHTNLTEEEAFRQERYWIKYHGRRDLGTGTLCNLTDGGDGGSNPSEESKRKNSVAHKGKTHSVESKRKMSKSSKGQVAWNKGIPHTIEIKQKISKAMKGNVKLAHWKGKTLSEETKQKMKIAQQRRWNKE